VNWRSGIIGPADAAPIDGGYKVAALLLPVSAEMTRDGDGPAAVQVSVTRLKIESPSQLPTLRCQFFEPLGVLGSADLEIAPLRLSQQLRAPHVVAEQASQFGAPLTERGCERPRSRAFDQLGSAGKGGFGVRACRWTVASDERTSEDAMSYGFI